jgi:hypothetical protein
MLTSKDIIKIEEMFETGFEKQAILIKDAFQSEREYADLRLDKKLKEELSPIKDQLNRIEGKVDRALHRDYVNLEGRVTRIEKKVGLKKPR